MDDYSYLYKVVLIGNAGVGKTCLVRRFTQGLFLPGQGATIGVDFMIKSLSVCGEKIKLQIWDTAGQERFRSITQSYYRSANALIIVYDVCCQSSFESINHWLDEVEKYATSDVIVYLVGNKSDQINQREMPTSAGENFARRYEMRFLETSAKESDNVEELFYSIARELCKVSRTTELKSSHSIDRFFPANMSNISNGCCKG